MPNRDGMDPAEAAASCIHRAHRLRRGQHQRAARITRAVVPYFSECRRVILVRSQSQLLIRGRTGRLKRPPVLLCLQTMQDCAASVCKPRRISNNRPGCGKRPRPCMRSPPPETPADQTPLICVFHPQSGRASADAEDAEPVPVVTAHRAGDQSASDRETTPRLSNSKLILSPTGTRSPSRRATV